MTTLQKYLEKLGEEFAKGNNHIRASQKNEHLQVLKSLITQFHSELKAELVKEMPEALTEHKADLSKDYPIETYEEKMAFNQARTEALEVINKVFGKE